MVKVELKKVKSVHTFRLISIPSTFQSSSTYMPWFYSTYLHSNATTFVIQGKAKVLNEGRGSEARPWRLRIWGGGARAQ